MHCHECDGVLMAECHGKLTFENTRRLRDAIREKMTAHKRLVIDLKEVPLMDSSGLGALAGLYVSGRSRGCQVQVINASQQIRQLFSMTNLLLLFEPVGRHHGKII